MRASRENPALGSLGPAGYHVAVRVGFAYPLEEYVSLPPEWIARYISGGFLPDDPVTRWAYGNEGVIRWSALSEDDPRGILSEAAAHGLRFGAIASWMGGDAGGQRSYGAFVRDDREYTDAELAELMSTIQRLHVDRTPPTNLTEAELQALGMVKNGLLLKEIAALLEVSEGAVKQRLKNARCKLKAKTGTHAATLAAAYGLI